MTVFQKITGTIILRSFCGESVVDATFEGEPIANCIANILARLGE